MYSATEVFTFVLFFLTFNMFLHDPCYATEFPKDNNETELFWVKIEPKPAVTVFNCKK